MTEPTMPDHHEPQTNNERLPVVDGHVHFWNLRNPDVSYDWLGPDERHPSIGDIDGLKIQRFAAPEFAAISRFQNVIKAVHVGVTTAADPVVETEWLQRIADVGGVPHGIVARCDLADAQAATNLARHLRSPNLRGIRDNGSPGSFADPQWRNGYRQLAEHDLVFCHEVGPDRVAEALELVTAIPAVTLCLDHAGMPQDLTREHFQRWSDGIRALAEHENVVVKISAFGQWAGQWTIDVLRPWVEVCLDAFGPDRSLFGSNFPVDGLFANYSDLVDAFRLMIADRPVDDQRQILAGTAERVFRL